MSRFEGKIGLITGGASGIGRATAQRLALEGAQVIIEASYVTGTTLCVDGGRAGLALK